MRVHMTNYLKKRIENKMSNMRHKDEVDQIIGSNKVAQTQHKQIKVYELVRLILDEDIDDDELIEIEDSERPMLEKKDVMIRRFNDKLKNFQAQFKRIQRVMYRTSLKMQENSKLIQSYMLKGGKRPELGKVIEKNVKMHLRSSLCL